VTQNENNNIPMLPATTGDIVKDVNKLYATGPQSNATGKVKVVKQATKTTVHGGWYSEYQKPSDKYKAVTPMSKNLLFQILSVQSDTGRTIWMERRIVSILDKWIKDGQPISYEWDAQKTGNIYVTKGDGPVYPTMVAHTDTVHMIVPDNQYMVRSDGKQMWAWNPVRNVAQGIGGDDKVGIFIALSMIQMLPTAKAAFFVDEEIGCVGSGKAEMSFFKDSTFVLECDRKGNRDFVNRIFGTDLYGKDFSRALGPILKTFRYNETSGGLTDVLELKDMGLGVACANMSCGYFNPHSSSEFISLPDVQRTFDLVYAIMTQLGDRQWVHKRVVKKAAKWTPTTQSDEWAWDKSARKFTRMTQTTTSAIDDAQWAELYANALIDDDSVWTDKLAPGYLETDLRSATDDVSELRARFPKLYGQLTVSQLLDEDREKLIDAAIKGDRDKLNEDFLAWADATGFVVGSSEPIRYPECPGCRQDSRVIWDDMTNEYWCIDCDCEVPSADIFAADDETQMPDGVESVYFTDGTDTVRLM
jgi:tripeptide aminopeptidase